MDRRKFLIGAGVAGAGASAALGTGAFDTVRAERTATVSTAGDASANLALEPAAGASSELAQLTDGTLELTISDVNQNAVTEIGELFAIQNNGTQAMDVFLRDDSDAVTFTSAGASIEGPDNSVRLSVGERITVGVTVDTTTGESGTLLNSVTVIATAESAPGNAANAAFDLLVDGDGSSTGAFATLDAALTAASPGDSIGIDGTFSISDAVPIEVYVPSVSVVAATAGSGFTTSGVSQGATIFEITAEDVTFEGLTIAAEKGDGTDVRPFGIVVSASGARLIGNTISASGFGFSNGGQGTPGIKLTASAVLRGNTLTGGFPISLKAPATAVDNTVSDALTEGIFAFGFAEADEFVVRDNDVIDHDRLGGGARELKFSSQPAELNGQTALDDQFDALLADNPVATVEIAGGGGVIVDPDAATSDNAIFGTTVQNAVDAAGTGGFVRVRADTFTPTGSSGNGVIEVTADGLTIRGDGQSQTVLDATSRASDVTEAISDRATDGTIEDLTVVGPSTTSTYESEFGIKTRATSTDPTLSGFTVRNVTVRDSGNVELQLSDVDDVLVEGVRVDGASQPIGAGIGIEDTNSGTNGTFVTERDITIRDVTFVNNAYGGIGVFNGASDKAAVTGITLEGDLTFSTSVPQLYVEDETEYTNVDSGGSDNQIVGDEIVDDSGSLTHRALIDDNEQSTTSAQESGETDLDRGSFRYFYTSKEAAVKQLNDSTFVGGPDDSTAVEVTIERI